jgi:hypothetical protein
MRGIVEDSASDLRSRPTETVDMCSDNAALCLDWLRAGHETHQDGAVAALSDSAVAV